MPEDMLLEQKRLQAVDYLEKSRRSLYEAEVRVFGEQGLHEHHREMQSLRERISELLTKIKKP